MKEKIYTIPVTEAYEAECECPLCFLTEKLETEAIDYALGAAMMEPDYRVASNEKGYCNRHFERMFKRPNKLSLALVLETHLEELQKKIDNYEKNVMSLDSSKGGLFRKSSNSSEISRNLSDTLTDCENSCLICDKINDTISRYCDVLLYMWANDEVFRKKFGNSHGVCLRHERMLLETVPKSLNDKQSCDFLKELFRIQKQNIEKHRESLHKFVLKFDYRYKDMELEEAKTAVPDAIEKISGYIQKEN